jgi:hypothetical protein
MVAPETFMKFNFKAIAVVAVLALSVLSMAQQPAGGGRGQRGGFGGGGTQSEALLVRRADVQTDLNLTADQKASLDKIFQDSGMGGRGAGGAGGNRGGGAGAPGTPGAGGGAAMTPEQMAEMRAKREAQMKELEGKIHAVLSPDQNKRLHEIRVQLAKNRAILSDDVAKDLGLSDDVKAKAKALVESANKANTEVRQKMQAQEIERADGQAIMEKNNNALEAELGKLLTADQAAKLKSMGGAEFKAQPQQGRRAGGGGN